MCPHRPNTQKKLPAWMTGSMNEKYVPSQVVLIQRLYSQNRAQHCGSRNHFGLAFWNLLWEENFWWEDANPFIIIISNDYVPTGMHSYSCGTLQLPRRASSYAKTTFELSIIGKYLKNKLHSLQCELAQKSSGQKQEIIFVVRTTGQNMQALFEVKPTHTR